MLSNQPTECRGRTLPAIFAGLATSERLWRYPPTLLAVTVVMYAVTLARSSGVVDVNADIIGRDYFAFFMAGDLVNQGRIEDLYNASAHAAYQQQFMADINPAWTGTYPYRNPPHYAWAMSWLARLGYGPSLVAWSLLSLLCFAVTALIWRSWLRHGNDRSTGWPRSSGPGGENHARDVTPPSREVGHPGRPGGRWRSHAPLAIMLVVCMPSWFQALGGGQNTFISLLILTGFCALLIKGRDWAAGLVLSLLAFKFYLIAVPGLVLLAKRRWLAVGGLALGALLTLALTAAALGPGVIADYVQYAPSQARLMEEDGFQIHKQHCWHGFFELLGRGWMPRESARILAVTASLASLALLVPLWRGRWDNRQPDFAVKLAALMVATLLTSPHLLHYDVLLAALPAILWFRASRSPDQANLRNAVKPILLAGFCWLAVAEPVARITHLQLTPLLMLWWMASLARAGVVGAAIRHRTLQETVPAATPTSY